MVSGQASAQGRAVPGAGRTLCEPTRLGGRGGLLIVGARLAGCYNNSVPDSSAGHLTVLVHAFNLPRCLEA